MVKVRRGWKCDGRRVVRERDISWKCTKSKFVRFERLQEARRKPDFGQSSSELWIRINWPLGVGSFQYHTRTYIHVYIRPIDCAISYISLNTQLVVNADVNNV